MNTRQTKKRVSIDEKQFSNDLLVFVNNLENKSTLDEDLYQKFVDQGVNKIALDKMIESIKIFSSYDQDKSAINFPFEDWIDRLLASS